MATILNDNELKKLLGTVIINGDASSVRPNSYVLRLGDEGEFLNATKEFTLGKTKKGIRVPPGHSVAITSLEIIDFRPATVAKIYPDCALHAILSPSTDLSREGIVAPATQIDAGYREYPFRVLMVFKTAERRNNTAERLIQHNPPVFTQVCLSTFEEVKINPLGAVWIQPIDYRAATSGTPFDPAKSRETWGYQRQTAREHFVEQKVRKRRILVDEAEEMVAQSVTVARQSSTNSTKSLS